jgi:hypothetical protein
MRKEIPRPNGNENAFGPKWNLVNHHGSKRGVIGRKFSQQMSQLNKSSPPRNVDSGSRAKEESKSSSIPGKNGSSSTEEVRSTGVLGPIGGRTGAGLDAGSGRRGGGGGTRTGGTGGCDMAGSSTTWCGLICVPSIFIKLPLPSSSK